MCRYPARFVAVIALVATVSLVGCKTQRSPEPSADQAVRRDADGYLARPAAALVFDPPAVYDLDSGRLADALDRTGRDEYAVLGYDSPVIETSYVYVDDRQGVFGLGFGGYGYGYGGYGGGGFGGSYDSYQRRAISTREFVRYRE